MQSHFSSSVSAAGLNGAGPSTLATPSFSTIARDKNNPPWLSSSGSVSTLHQIGSPACRPVGLRSRKKYEGRPQMQKAVLPPPTPLPPRQTMLKTSERIHASIAAHTQKATHQHCLGIFLRGKMTSHFPSTTEIKPRLRSTIEFLCVDQPSAIQKQ